ncbi:osteoclast-associated immunoglobulin-like receptor isoform X2 [Hemicordylus capensis]|nr:osteoclast-associated immunoglobulin-like receptor isoform X2 [Hemicordylus capensis]
MSLRKWKVLRGEWNGTVYVKAIVKAEPSDAGIYCCQCCLFLPVINNANQVLCSYHSDNVQINITDASLPKPTIKMQPRRQLALGMNATIECQGPNNGLIHSLHKSQNLTATQVADKFTANFFFPMLTREDAGSYTCKYQQKDKPFVWSESSDSLKLVLRDPNLPKPTIEMMPKGPHDPGMNVTIKCQGPYKGLNFSLFKPKDRITFLSTEPEKNTAEFHLSRVSVDNEGIYTCQYHHSAYAFILSKPSDPVKIIVRDSRQISDSFQTIRFASYAGGLLLLLVALIWCSNRRKGCTANERTQPLPVNKSNMYMEADAEADPDGVSYGALNHHPLKTKRTDSPDSVSKSNVYISVASNGIRKSK